MIVDITREESLGVTTLLPDSFRVDGRLHVDGFQIVGSDHVCLVSRRQNSLGTHDTIDF